MTILESVKTVIKDHDITEAQTAAGNAAKLASVGGLTGAGILGVGKGVKIAKAAMTNVSKVQQAKLNLAG